MEGNCFLQKKVADDSVYILWVTLSHTVPKISEFYVSCRNSKWRENNFWQKVQDDSAYTLWIKNFVEIAIFCF